MKNVNATPDHTSPIDSPTVRVGSPSDDFDGVEGRLKALERGEDGQITQFVQHTNTYLWRDVIGV
ncbi:hypothetical protein [Halalkalicoccus ordinarius]|uniref:hypothetical protein n=1 Tax=Halalkalicoccus ordinarius TaxID=3116651 RepID=UPI00300EEBEC